MQAYELSPRERDVKAVFEKVGVLSRGELVARLFAERYAALRTAPADQERAGT